MTLNEILDWIEKNVVQIQQTSVFGPDMILVELENGNLVAGHSLQEVVEMEVNDEGGKLVLENNEALKQFMEVKQGGTQQKD